MPKRGPEVSIIIVHYKVKNLLFDCIDSITKSTRRVQYEIIVVDNDEKKVIKNELTLRFPWVMYVENPVNNGWGGGVNLGERYASGKYLYLLNPDTIVMENAIDQQIIFVKKHKNVGVVASLLLDANSRPYPLQGTQKLTPFTALIVYSFLNTLFSNNPISRKFWLFDWNKKNVITVDVAPLTASLVPRRVFNSVGGFDELFFLYFEEYDFSTRIAKAGYRSYINPVSKVIHKWGASSKYSKHIDKIFFKSRFLYFKKYFGSIIAFIIQLLLSLNIKSLKSQLD